MPHRTVIKNGKYCFIYERFGVCIHYRNVYIDDVLALLENAAKLQASSFPDREEYEENYTM
jgi:hypothetical protein